MGILSNDAEDRISMDIDVSGGRVGNIVGEQFNKLPSPTEEIRKKRLWQADTLTAAIPDYAGEQQNLRQQVLNPPRPASPYKGLNYFDPLEQAIFFGREALSDDIARRILQPTSRLIVLHAPSGAGKTSLIRAGLIPRLVKQGIFTLYAAPTPYPESVYEPVTRYILDRPDFDDLPLSNFLLMLAKSLECSPDAPLVVFLDQFERISREKEKLSGVERDLENCIQATDYALPVRIIIAVRRDFLGWLDEFPIVRERLDAKNRVYLRELTRVQTLQAIIRPLDGWDVKWDPVAAETVLVYLLKSEIEPPHLQLIGSQLYERAVAEERMVITPDMVEEHDLIAMHREYLRREMDRLGELEPHGWALLKDMITSDGLAVPCPRQDIEDRLGKKISDSVLDTLVARRVLRSERFAGRPRIVIAHDSLAVEIQAHESPQEIRLKAVRERIKRGFDEYFSHESRPLMDMGRLQIIDEERDLLSLPLMGFENQADRERQTLEFMLRSALNAEYAVSYWHALARAGGVEVEPILHERLRSDKFQERAAVISVLTDIENFASLPLIISMLADDYPQVRAAAVQALEKLQPSGEWRAELAHECYVPGGDFLMGDEKSERDNEKPAHRVYLEAFYIAKTTVTNAEFRRYSEANNIPYEYPAEEDDHPAVRASWYQAREYAAWARMRLPSEAEWEKAASWEARTGQEPPRKRVYPWGDEFDPQRCNTRESGKSGTTPIDFYQKRGASPCGAWDMAGNVREWCSSLYKPYPYDPDDGREGVNVSGSRVLRGGAFGNGASDARCAYRVFSFPSYRWSYLGFRVVCGASPISPPGS